MDVVFSGINVNFLSEPITVVVPDGCYDSYYPKFVYPSIPVRDLIELGYICLIEYSEFLQSV